MSENITVLELAAEVAKAEVDIAQIIIDLQKKMPIRVDGIGLDTVDLTRGRKHIKGLHLRFTMNVERLTGPGGNRLKAQD